MNLEFAANSVLCGQEPIQEDFSYLVSQIETRELFPGKAKRMVGSTRKVTRFFLDRTRSGKHTEYQLYTIDENQERLVTKRKLGYRIFTSDGNIHRVNRVNNPYLPEWGIEVLVFERKYL